MPDGNLGDAPDLFHADPARSHTLAAPYYYRPEVYEAEKERVFYRSWNYVAHASQLAEPLSQAAASIADRMVLVTRAENGELRATLDGAQAPVRIETYCGFVFANLDPDAASLASQAGELESEIRSYAPRLDELVFSHRKTYTFKANWKNVVDNFLECYHCTPAHPAFVDLVDIQNYRSVCHGLYSTHTSPPGRVDNKAYTIEPVDGTVPPFATWWLWPNITFGANPGPPNLTILHIMPVGPELTFEHLDFFFLKPEPSANEWDLIRYVDDVLQPEDIALTESVQRGLHSKSYRQGRFIVDRDRTFVSEHAVHHFHAQVLKALGRDVNQAG